MRRAVANAVKNMSSRDHNKILSGIKTIRGLGGLEGDEIGIVLPAILATLKIDNAEINNVALDTLIKLSSQGPEIAAALAQPIAMYLDRVCSLSGRHPNRYLGRITKSVAIIGIITRFNPKVAQIAVPALAKVISPPIYRPDRKETWVKLYAAVTKTLAIIGHNNPSILRPAVKHIVRCVGDTFKYKTLKMNARRPDGLRWQAVLALKEIMQGDPKAVVPHLLKAAGDDNREVRQFMLNSIISISKNTDIVIPYIMNGLDDKLPSVRRSAEYLLDVIAKSYPDEVEEYLPALLNHPKKEVKLNGIRIFALIGQVRPESLKPHMKSIQDWCNDPNRDIRRLAVDTIGKIGERNPEIVDPLLPFVVNALRDSEESVRLTAITTLSTIATKRPDMIEFAIPGLIERLRDPREHIVWRTRELLMKLNVDPIEYPRSRRMLDKANKTMASSVRNGINVPDEIKALIKEAENALMGRDYNRCYELSQHALRKLGDIRAMEQEIKGTEPGSMAPVDDNSVGVEWVEIAPGTTMEPLEDNETQIKGKGYAEEDYESLGPDIRDVETLPLTQKVTDLISRVERYKAASSEHDTDYRALGHKDYISELLERFKREMAEITLSTTGIDEDLEDESVQLGVKNTTKTESGVVGEGEESAGSQKAVVRMFCHYCGNRIPPDSIYCNKCGRKLI